MALPCLRWHGFAFGLGRHIFLSHKHTHTLIQEGNTGSQRCLETHTDTHTNTHNGQHWFPVWHYLAVSDTAEGSGYSLDPTMQTNKHSMHSLSPRSLINTPPTFYRQPFTNNNFWQKTAYLDHYHLNCLITCFLLFFPPSSVFIVSRCASFWCSVCIFSPPSPFPLSLKEMGFSWLHGAVLTAWLVWHNVEPSNR